MFEKIDGKIYKVTTTKVLVDLKALKEELAVEQDMPEPTDEELIEHGKANHPYYFPVDTSKLEAKIAEIEKEIDGSPSNKS